MRVIDGITCITEQGVGNLCITALRVGTGCRTSCVAERTGVADVITTGVV